jgi:hypothetical protein
MPANLLANPRPVCLRGIQFVVFLDVHPEFRCHPEESPQPQAQICVQTSPFLYDSNQLPLRNLDFLGQHLSRHLERIKEILTQELSRMNGRPLLLRPADHRRLPYKYMNSVPALVRRSLRVSDSLFKASYDALGDSFSHDFVPASFLYGDFLEALVELLASRQQNHDVGPQVEPWGSQLNECYRL